MKKRKKVEDDIFLKMNLVHFQALLCVMLNFKGSESLKVLIDADNCISMIKWMKDIKTHKIAKLTKCFKRELFLEKKNFLFLSIVEQFSIHITSLCILYLQLVSFTTEIETNENVPLIFFAIHFYTLLIYYSSTH